MAQQEGLFKKNGLDVELLHISSSSRGIQAILAGEIAFSYMDGSNAGPSESEGRKHRLGRRRHQPAGLFPDGETGNQDESPICKRQKDRHHPGRLFDPYFGALRA